MLKLRLHLIYSLIWIIITMIHISILVWGYHLQWQPALVEGVVFNLMFAFLGVGLFFMVQYSDLNSRSWQELLFVHLSGLTVVLGVWIVPAYVILKNVFANDPEYIAFLNHTTIARVLTGTGLYLAVVSIAYLMVNLRRLRSQHLREAELQALLKDSELSMLRFQINPHFLFNSLNAISSLIITRPEEANQMVIRLSEFMRYSLDSDGKALSTLGRELDHCRRYLDIERVRFGEWLKVNVLVDEELLALPVPAMLLQPLAENAVKHGVYDLEEGMRVDIHISRTEEWMTIVVSNPVDPSGNNPKSGTGTGLKNIRARLRLIFGRPDLMSIVNDGKIYGVTINLPLYGRTD